MLPRIHPVVAAGGGDGAAAVAAAGARPAEASAEIEMESLRPYREGAPASRIHWPTVARVGTLMERRLLADSDSQPLVVVDPTHPTDEAALDMAVRAAASLCVHLARRGGCSLLLPGDRRAVDIGPDLGNWTALHVRLALVEPSGGAAVRAARVAARRDLLGHGARGAAAGARAAAGRALPRRPRRSRAAARRSPSPDARALRSAAAGGGRRERAAQDGSRARGVRGARLVHGRALDERPDRRRAGRAGVRLRAARHRGRRRAAALGRLAGRPGRHAARRMHARRRSARGSWRSGSTDACSRPRIGTSSATASTAASPRSARSRGPTTARSPGRSSCCCSPCRSC